MSQIPNYFWPLMHYYYLDENVTPSRIEHSRSSTLLPYAIDVDPDRQETSSVLDHLEAKEAVTALQPHTPSIWHGFSLRRGPARKSTSGSSRKQSRKGRMPEWASGFSWILRSHRSTPSETSSGRASVKAKKTAAAAAQQQTVATPSVASWTASSSSSPSTTSFKLSYRSDNSSFTSLSTPPSPADVVVLNPYTFDGLSSQTYGSSDTEINSADMQGHAIEQVKACSDSLLDRPPRRCRTNTTTTTTSPRNVPNYHHHHFSHGKQHGRRPYGKLLYVPNFDVTLAQNGDCLQKCITDLEGPGGMSYPQFYPLDPGEGSHAPDGGPASPGRVPVGTPSSELGHAVVHQAGMPVPTRSLTIVKRNPVKPAFMPLTERSADVFVVMRALAAVGHQMDMDHDAHIRASLDKDPHEDDVDARVLNDQWCDVVLLDEYFGC